MEDFIIRRERKEDHRETENLIWESSLNVYRQTAGFLAG